MGYVGTQAVRRISFPVEIKNKILSKSNSKCSCCGTSLSLKTMTIEHVVPISRGGTNDEANLVALCLKCNQSKRNLICLPQSNFYHLNQKYYNETIDYFYDWFKKVKHNFDLDKYPLITQSSTHPVINTVGRKDFIVSNVTLQYCNQALRAEVEAVTGVTLDEAPYYILKSFKTDKLLTLLRVQPGVFSMNICCVWTCQQLCIVESLMRSIVVSLIETYVALQIPVYIINYTAHNSKFFNIAYSYKDAFSKWGESFDAIYERNGKEFSGVHLKIKRSLFLNND